MPIKNILLTLMLAWLLPALAVPVAAEENAASAAGTTVFITGANRGLGFEFAKQYAERGYRVIATARRPDEAEELKALRDEYPGVVIEELDVTDFEQIDALAEKYRGQPIDILINNAGITGDPFRTQMFGRVDYSVFDKVMHVNALGPLKITEAFYEHVRASDQKKVITVSSSMGSIARTFGTGYFYRSSKAAVNMIMASLAKELARKGIIVGLVNPGPTATDMMNSMGGNMKLREPDVATADMIRNIDNLTLETTGSFLQYDGTILPW